ncbi:uncharacterized protein KD926_010679 [Aspergillus affinis]|uniref:uncharacterized protein n=1 Tax=Aspergillus affinis TaxID=1070780 RepID=UPI0022FF322F|nr:uncharacterized protein KD926_010679 [Aspergillus affinis]KAI9038550.1 hypothetical protein KD926_010679 [Aspergillus affinis]
MSLDLSLPATCPALCGYLRYSWDLAAFALYTLIDHYNYGSEVPLVRLPETYNLAGRILKDVVQAHVDLDKEATLDPNLRVPGYEYSAIGDVGFYPTAFLVVTTPNWDNEGVPFVFMDDTDVSENEDTYLDPEVRPMDKFSMPLDEAQGLLESFSLSNLGMLVAKEQYGLEQNANRKNDGDEYPETEPPEREEDIDNDEDDVGNDEAAAGNSCFYRLSDGEVIFAPGGASIGDEIFCTTTVNGKLQVTEERVVEEVAGWDNKEESAGNGEDVDNRGEDVNSGEEDPDVCVDAGDSAYYRLSNGDVVLFPGGASVGDEVLIPTFTHPGLDVRVSHVVEELVDYEE